MKSPLIMTKRKKQFECKDRVDGLVDVVVQCQMLGEGYDNPYIAVSTFIAPALNVSTLAQYHGRAIRRNYDLNHDTYPQSLVSWMFYPNEPRVQEIVDEYKNCVDEEEIHTNVFSEQVYKDLKTAHGILAKKSSAEFVKELGDRQKFDAYHEKYADKRLKWNPIPAERVAERLYEEERCPIRTLPCR